MPNPARIYVSVPNDTHLDKEQLSLKNAILEAIKAEGFQLEIFLKTGTPRDEAWSFEGANSLMFRCHGAAVLAFAKWRAARQLNGEVADLPSEYNHFEGALAIAHNVPLLLVTDRRVTTSGITYVGGGMKVYFWRDQGIDSPDFREYLRNWADKVTSHRKIFLGYCSRARPTADAVTLYIEHQLRVRVENYAMDFRPGGSILEQIEKAARECACGVFLFTRDDDIGPLPRAQRGRALRVGAEAEVAPRDNVIFETGYFIRAKGKERVLIIREEGTRMPADLGGVVYILMKNREDIANIQEQIRSFLDDRL
jgi:hypothetical protein